MSPPDEAHRALEVALEGALRALRSQPPAAEQAAEALLLANSTTEVLPGVTKALLSIKETAAFLSISRTTLYRLMRETEFPVIAIGGSRRVPAHRLADWVRSQPLA